MCGSSMPFFAESSEEAVRQPDSMRHSLFRTAEATGQDIIDPRATRPLLVEFVRDAQRILASHLGPSPVTYRP